MLVWYLTQDHTAASMADVGTPIPATAAMRAGVITGTAAMACVGSSAAVSARLAAAPVLTAQAIRYAAACLLLAVLARATGRRLVWPRGTEWGWLLGTAVTGLALFNIALVRGTAHAEPAVFGVAVASVPLLLAVIAPVIDRQRPAPRLIAAAMVVTAGAALVQAGGRTDRSGLAWAAVVLLCETAFTLLAVPILRRLGAWSLSVHTTGIGAVLLAGLGAAVDGPAAAGTLSGGNLLTLGYLAIVVTGLGFVLWYSAVNSLGAARAGLLTGMAPLAAAGTGVLLGGPLPRPAVWAGVVAVAAGLATGLRTGSASTGVKTPRRVPRPLPPSRQHAGSRPAPRAARDSTRTNPFERCPPRGLVLPSRWATHPATPRADRRHGRVHGMATGEVSETQPSASSGACSHRAAGPGQATATSTRAGSRARSGGTS